MGCVSVEGGYLSLFTVQIKYNATYFGYSVKNSNCIEKNISGYTLRNLNFRPRIRILKQAHCAKKCIRRPFGLFSIQFVAKYQKKLNGRPLKIEKHLKVFEKSHNAKKIVSSGFYASLKWKK